MKKTIQILIFVLIYLSAFAQEKKDSISKNKWSLGLSIAPIYAYPTYGATGNIQTIITPGAMILVKYKISKAIDFFSGVDYDGLQYKDELNGPGFIIKDNFKYSLINVPLKLGINSGKKKISFSMFPSINICMLTNSKIQSYRPNYVVFKYFNIGSIFISASLSASINYKLSNKIIFFFEPQFNKAITPIVYLHKNLLGETVSDNNYLKYFKFNLGMYYNFKKTK